MSTQSNSSAPRPTDPTDLLNHVLCGTCRREIPFSEAVVPEAVDYVIYFCGLDCYDRWRDQAGGC